VQYTVQGELNTLDSEIDSIIESGVLGRSQVYPRLLRYLAAVTTEHRVASEIDIATDVFRKGGDFDSNQDSSIRVYVHNLRQRLDRFYADNSSKSSRVMIPKGEYRLDFGAVEMLRSDREDQSPSIFPTNYILYAIVALLLANLVLFMAPFSNKESEMSEVARSQVWTPILSSDRPLLIVVGDYFIFGELDSYGRISRMVREFNVNSPGDLEDLQEHQASSAEAYMNLDLSYLPQSMAFALNDVLSVVHSQDKRATIISSSKLRTSDLKSNDVLYLGYLSGLGILESYVFAASKLEIGSTYDELLHPDSGKYFFSNAGIPDRKTYQDFALLTTFPGPGPGNQILVAAGTRDAGLTYIAESLASYETALQISERMRSLDQDINSYEALYKVVGSDRTSLDASLIHDAVLNTGKIWTLNILK
jgi:hypothetical protein